MAKVGQMRYYWQRNGNYLGLNAMGALLVRMRMRMEVGVYSVSSTRSKEGRFGVMGIEEHKRWLGRDAIC